MKKNFFLLVWDSIVAHWRGIVCTVLIIVLALVTFSEFGDGVISANMSFVINGDKDNIFRRVYEIAEGLGEDTVKIALVK